MEDDPINFRQALESSNSQEWIDAMNEEIKSMKDNDVWDLVPLLERVKPIGCKWIFKTKGIRKVMWRDTKLVLSLKVIHKNKASIIKRLSLLFH